MMYTIPFNATLINFRHAEYADVLDIVRNKVPVVLGHRRPHQAAETYTIWAAWVERHGYSDVNVRRAGRHVIIEPRRRMAKRKFKLHEGYIIV